MRWLAGSAALFGRGALGGFAVRCWASLCVLRQVEWPVIFGSGLDLELTDTNNFDQFRSTRFIPSK